ncbi:V-type ATP synthase subunit D [Flexibacterium corallicola]|uniref:V-type ATP synthase subunit D n=1 Tax=Flexibacterium corallicola TaxID=3037259 RepID=UPI00286F23D6|nr:V-type ATP synthase subunit D [Pseudovibrio sp. M1P-2-3]
MTKLQLNKAVLSKKKIELKNYQKFLPSLDMKRKQLLALQKKAERDLNSLTLDQLILINDVGSKLPMLSQDIPDIGEMVSIEKVEVSWGNTLGVNLPEVKKVILFTHNYSYFATPIWLDSYIREFKCALELSVRIKYQRHRLEILSSAVRKATQKVNLFDKVLIPRTKEELQRINISLADTERAEVVISKIAKKKRLAITQGGKL